MGAHAALLPISWGPVDKKLISQGPSDVFPVVQGMNLEGDKMILPQGLTGALNIVIVAFKREQQEDVDTWIKALEAYIQDNPKIKLYELPTLKTFNLLMRFNINNGMRYGIPNKQSRKQTITLYIDKKSFKSRLLIPNEDHIQILLLNNAGKIFWRASGLASQEKIKALKTKIKLVKG